MRKANRNLLEWIDFFQKELGWADVELAIVKRDDTYVIELAVFINKLRYSKQILITEQTGWKIDNSIDSVLEAWLEQFKLELGDTISKARQELAKSRGLN